MESANTNTDTIATAEVTTDAVVEKQAEKPVLAEIDTINEKAKDVITDNSTGMKTA